MKRQIRKPGECKSEILSAIPKACIDETTAVDFMEKQRWGETPKCPHCGSTEVVKMTDGEGGRNARYLWRCHACKKQYTVRIGTVFEDSRIPLRHWCRAFWRACSSKKGISALQISRECSLSYKSALFMMHRIRYAMTEQATPEKLTGIVEADETYVGGNPTGSGHHKHGWGTKKTPVFAVVERSGDVRARVIANVTSKTLKKEILDNVDLSARLCTDELKQYVKVGRMFAGGHGTVQHGAKEYANGADHINTAEGFFSLLKRKFYGTHHAVSKKHLHRYISEAVFQWNTRKVDDGERTAKAIRSADGKRLMYRQPHEYGYPKSLIADKRVRP